MTAQRGPGLAASMPLTAAWMRQMRTRWGDKHVTDVVKRGMAGERNCFYAVEAGHFAGAPFTWEAKGQMIVSMSILTGERFVAAILAPDGQVDLVIAPAEGSAHGAH